MYCLNCGTLLPDEANFCSKCGKPQRTDIAAYKRIQPRYEICEIVYQIIKSDGFLSTGKLQFWAKATGKEGNYNVGESVVFTGSSVYMPARDNTDVVDAHDGLIKKLMADGWERTENQGRDWYSFIFRRQMDPDK